MLGGTQPEWGEGMCGGETEAWQWLRLTRMTMATRSGTVGGVGRVVDDTVLGLPHIGPTASKFLAKQLVDRGWSVS